MFMYFNINSQDVVRHEKSATETRAAFRKSHNIPRVYITAEYFYAGNNRKSVFASDLVNIFELFP